MTATLDPVQESLKVEGNSSFKSGDSTRAIELFSKALALPGGNAVGKSTLFSNRSACYMVLRDYEAALEDAEQAIQSNSTWPKAHSRKAAALYALGRFREAAEAYVGASEVAGSGPEAEEYRKMEAKARLMYSSTPTREEEEETNDSIIVVALRAVSLGLALMWFLIGDRAVYAVSVSAMLASSVISILQIVGRPRFSADYLERVVRVPVKPFVLLSTTFLTIPPSLPAMLCLQLVSIGRLARYGQEILNRYAPSVASKIGHYVRTSSIVARFMQLPGWEGMTTSQRFAEFDRKMDSLSGRLEVVVMAVLVFQLLTPSGSYLSLLVYPQILKLRYMANESTRAAIHALDATLSSAALRHPFAQKTYAFVRNLVVSFKNQGSRDRNTGRFNTTDRLSKCVVM